MCLHKQVPGGTTKAPTVETLAACAPSNAGIPTFDDTNPDAYWSSANPLSSTKVAGHGVKATVTGDSGGVLTVSVTNPVGLTPRTTRRRPRAAGSGASSSCPGRQYDGCEGSIWLTQATTPPPTCTASA